MGATPHGYDIPDTNAFDGPATVARMTARSEELGRWIVDGDPSDRFPIFTRANIGEVFPDAVMPFSWTLWGIPYSEIGWRQALCNLGAFDMDEFTPNAMEMLNVFGGYGYLNVSASRIFGVRTPGMSAEAIDASFFGEQPDVPPYVARATDTSPRHSERLGEMLGGLFTTTGFPELAAMQAEMKAVAAARPDLSAMKDAELLERTRSLCAAHWLRLWVRHIMATYHSMIPTGVIGGVCAAVGKPELAADILGAAGDVDSALPAKALWQLGRVVRQSAALTAEFDAGLSGLDNRLRQNHPDFAEQFAGFIKDYGFRGSQEWEMRSAAWELQPSAPLAAIDRLRYSEDNESPDARMDKRRAGRAAAIEIIRTMLGDAPEAAQFEGAIAVAGLTFAARERTKTNCVLATREMRMPMWELGRRMVAGGHFEKADQFALLTNAEWDIILTDPGAARAIIEQREAKFETLAALVPPFIVNGVVPPLDSFARRDASSGGAAKVGDVLAGQAGCAGTVRGIARIVMDPAEPGDLEPGDILIAPHTDPSWTPLFAFAAGIVVDVGATISHAVIVARELGVPCATSVTGATKRIRDGALVEVNGAAGTVTVLADPI
jgi:rifampicin phosphotransferase